MVCLPLLSQSWQDFCAFLPLKQHWILPSPLPFFAYSYLRAFHVEIWAPKAEKLFTSIKQETFSKQRKCGRWGSKPRGKRHGGSTSQHQLDVDEDTHSNWVGRGFMTQTVFQQKTMIRNNNNKKKQLRKMLASCQENLNLKKLSVNKAVKLWLSITILKYKRPSQKSWFRQLTCAKMVPQTRAYFP